MRRFALSAALLCALAAPAAAGQILYATAAADDRVDGFCLGPNGGLTVAPKLSVDTVDSPRRLVVEGDVLYVAGRTRVESFRIGPNGGLERLGKTKALEGANLLDIAVDEARTHVYVPRRGAGRIEAHPLDASGALTGADFTSCAATSVNVVLQEVEVAGAPGAELLYVTESTSPFAGGKRGRVDVFPLVGGELPDAPDSFRCDPKVTTTTSTSTSSTTLTTTNTTSTTSTTIDDRITPPLSTRKKLRAPGLFALIGDFIYVYDIFNRKLGAFRLENGLFTDEQQPRESKTGQVGQLLDLAAFDTTLIASQVSQGRVRAFALKPEGGVDGAPLTVLPNGPQRTTRQIIQSTPVRMAVAEFCKCAEGDTACEADPPSPPCPGESSVVLYVSGGESFRVHAYRVVETSKGQRLPEASPFSQTDERQGTFPNDVAVARNVACP